MDNPVVTIIISILTSASASAAIAAALLWLTKSWISERLKSAIKYEYDQKLESHKAQLQAGQNRDLEVLKTQLKAEADAALAQLTTKLRDATAERDARRDYEYEARKRLYEQYEPLLFQLVERSEGALYRIYSLARSAREGALRMDGGGWLDGEGYYMVSTMYMLLAPSALFRLMQNRLTLVDLSVDPAIAAQYALAKILYISFTCDFEIARCAPPVEYEPNVSDWKTRRQECPEKYWRQGIALGRLDNVLDDMIVNENGARRLRTFGEYARLVSSENKETAPDTWQFADIFRGFHSCTRPVLWRVLIAQAHVHRLILDRKYSAAPSPMDYLTTNLTIPQDKRGVFDWRSEDVRRPEDEVLQEPFEVGAAFVAQYVRQFLGHRD